MKKFKVVLTGSPAFFINAEVLNANDTTIQLAIWDSTGHPKNVAIIPISQTVSVVEVDKLAAS